MELVKLIEFSLFEEDNGNLAVFEENYDSIPFSIKRIFNVRSQKNSIRGMHAHRLCSQLLVCSRGSIQVTCDNSVTKEIYILDKPNYGLLIPPGIWAEQKYLLSNSSMTVICDRLYEEQDYIRDYEDFKVFKNSLTIN